MQALPYVMAGMSALQGIGSAQEASYGAAVAARNAQIEERNAAEKMNAARLEAQDTDQSARQEIGALIANMSASGVSLDSGSSAGAVASQTMLAERDRERLIRRGERERDNSLQAAADLKAQSKQLKKSAKFSMLTIPLSAATSYFSGASMVNKWNNVKLAGQP